MRNAAKIAELKAMKNAENDKAARTEEFKEGYNKWLQAQAKRQRDGFWYDDWSGYSEPYDYVNF